MKSASSKMKRTSRSWLSYRIQMCNRCIQTSTQQSWKMFSSAETTLKLCITKSSTKWLRKKRFRIKYLTWKTFCTCTGMSLGKTTASWIRIKKSLLKSLSLRSSRIRNKKRVRKVSFKDVPRKFLKNWIVFRGGRIARWIYCRNRWKKITSNCRKWSRGK
jgi:hypothetical protein